MDLSKQEPETRQGQIQKKGLCICPLLETPFLKHDYWKVFLLGPTVRSISFRGEAFCKGIIHYRFPCFLSFLENIRSHPWKCLIFIPCISGNVWNMPNIQYQDIKNTNLIERFWREHKLVGYRRNWLVARGLCWRHFSGAKLMCEAGFEQAERYAGKRLLTCM